MNKTVGSVEYSIAQRLRGGDDSAMRTFYDMYSSSLLSICQRYVADDDDAKDVLQESLIKIFTSFSKYQYRGEGSLRAWSARIAVNQALTYLRNKKALVSIEECNISSLVDDDEININEIPQDVMQDMIRRLPNGYRTVFNLYVFENLSHKEIAARLGIKENTSASQLFRAKAMLMELAKLYRQKGAL